MFGMNENNNKYDKKDRATSTKGNQLYSLNGFDPSTLTMGYFASEYLAIKMYPALPEGERQQGGKQYDYKKLISIVLPMSVAGDFYREIQERLPELLDEKLEKDVSIGVPFKNSLIEIGNGYKFTKQHRPYVAIYKEIDENTRIPKVSIAFELNKGEVINNYNYKTGACEYKNVHSDLFQFIDYIGSSKDLCKATAHASRDTYKFIINKMFDNQAKIMTKLGIQDDKSDWGNGSNYSGGSSFSSFASSNRDETSVEQPTQTENVSFNDLM